MATKRSRSVNWTPAMKELLVEAVKPFSITVESKMNDGKTLKAKFEAWQSIQEMFNATGYCFTAKQIREQWNRLKTQARSKISAFSRSQKETGGGTPPKEPSEIDIEISAMSSVDFQLDSAEFDSDAIQAYEIENIPPPETPPQVKTKPKTRSQDVGKSPPKRSAIKRKAKKPTILTSEELIKKRIEQVKMETEKKQKYPDT
ncbi:uncharacterized protein LOC129941312 [Eupeodes corollae]|uniref:uncharacterized protein LOC129941312 n=1 Tax=Eupeodes corollae TaxID=290404 RepID=UPI002492A848|nr:uncharacterized protein LOC129941312 [Eupeodes corollae]